MLIEFPRQIKIAETRDEKKREKSSADLPNELLRHIFSFLDDKSLFCSSLTCKLWNTIITKEKEWQATLHNKLILEKDILNLKHIWDQHNLRLDFDNTIQIFKQISRENMRGITCITSCRNFIEELILITWNRIDSYTFNQISHLSLAFANLLLSREGSSIMCLFKSKSFESREELFKKIGATAKKFDLNDISLEDTNRLASAFTIAEIKDNSLFILWTPAIISKIQNSSCDISLLVRLIDNLSDLKIKEELLYAAAAEPFVEAIKAGKLCSEQVETIKESFEKAEIIHKKLLELLQDQNQEEEFPF